MSDSSVPGSDLGPVLWRNPTPYGVRGFFIVAMLIVLALGVHSRDSGVLFVCVLFTLCVMPLVGFALYKRVLAIHARGLVVRIAGVSRKVLFSELTDLEYRPASGSGIGLTAQVLGNGGAMGLFRFRCLGKLFVLDPYHFGRSDLLHCEALIRQGVAAGTASHVE